MTDGPTPEHPVDAIVVPDEVAASPIEFFELRMKLDTTLTINETHWMKPGVESAIRWKRLPDERELSDATTYIQLAVLNPAIAELISLLSQQLAEARKVR